MSDTLSDDQLAELASMREAEGDEIEAADEDATSEPEPEVEPSPSSKKELDSALDKLTREDDRHAKRVREIMGADFDTTLPCPLCSTLTAGFIFPAEVSPITPEQTMAVHVALGEPAVPDYRQAPETTACDECDGLGDVRTGSKNPLHVTKLCAKCDGKGWMANLAPSNVAQLQPPSYNPQSAAPYSVLAPPNSDAWGRPNGHPHWGQDPATVGYAG